MNTLLILSSAILLSLLVYAGFSYIPERWKEWLQTYAPSWIPREVLFSCYTCTSFWLSVPMFLGIWVLFEIHEAVFGPFVVSAMMKFWSDVL